MPHRHRYSRRVLAVARRAAAIALVTGLVLVAPPAPASSNEAATTAFELRLWGQALTGRDDAAATVLAIGDSITEGSTVGADQRWLTLVEHDLRAELPTAGLGSGGGRGLWPAFYSSFTLPLPTYRGAVTEASVGGPGERAVSIGVGGRVTYDDVVGTSVRVWHSTSGSGAPLQVRVDDRPPVTIDTRVPGLLEHGDRWTEVSTGGGVDSAHTVVVERGAGGSASPQLGGVELRNGDETRGIHVVDAAHSGASAGLFARGAGAVGDWVEGTHASLVLLALGFNDWHDGVAPPVFRDDLQAIVDDVRAADPRVPILLIAWPEATAAGYGGGFGWDEYVDAMASLAADNGDAALVDLSHLDVETTDGIHPSARANRELADRLLPVLLAATTYDPPP